MRGKMDKCTFCAGGPEANGSKAEYDKYGRNRLSEGKLPACAEMCSTKALLPVMATRSLTSSAAASRSGRPTAKQQVLSSLDGHGLRQEASQQPRQAELNMIKTLLKFSLAAGLVAGLTACGQEAKTSSGQSPTRRLRLLLTMLTSKRPLPLAIGAAGIRP